jgi:hypothetical protein
MLSLRDHQGVTVSAIAARKAQNKYLALGTDSIKLNQCQISSDSLLCPNPGD